MTRAQPTSPSSSSSSPVHIQTRNSSSHRHFFKHFHTNPKPFMEITSFPFLSQEDYSHFYTLFPDMDDFEINGEGGLKKRRRKEDDSNNNNNGAMSDILTTLILLDEEEKQEQEEFFVQTQQEKSILEANHRQKTQAMNEYLSDLQQNHAQSDELDQSRAKRTHQSAFAAAAAAAETANSGAGSESGSAVPAAGPHRRLWVKDRNKDWWDKYNNPNVSDDEFREAFRMSKATFDMICEELDSAVTKKNTMLRDAIPVRQRVAVCIWRLATGEPLRLVSKRFGLGISTCHKLVLEVCSAIKTVLMPKFLQWPDENRMKAIKDEFEASSGIPNVGGSMYTTHVPIIAPKVNVAAYFNKRHTERNQKTSYSITVQGVVDPRGVFTDVCIGWPGSMPDDQVLEKSALFQRANRGLLKDVWIVGNSGFPLTDWVLVPYTHQNLTWTQHAFNEKIGDVQRVAKDAFAKLKGRWSCLQKRTEVKLQDLPVVLGACCVLHNICAMRNEELDAKLSFDIFDDEIVPENSLRSATSVQARDHIAHNLLHHGLAGSAFL
ncbi:protein ALP1-like [Prunus avium]|uniref:Protein ALP1-like n=1 Tax=Prunus avium TaxID=42229 RepID=A0A6P5RPN1_PRUAV|nr:protein ALP1-like [Prunus avium]